MVRVAPFAVMVLLLTACGSSHSAASHPAPSHAAATGSSQPAAPYSAPTRSARATPASAGCGRTALHRGGAPAWTASAWSISSGPPTSLPYATSVHGRAAAFIFGSPLRAGDPSNPANKILWIVRLPRHGSHLVIRARPLHARAPVITVTRPADSSPGEIYPSYINVPKPGCWRLSLHWAGHSDTLDLRWTAQAGARTRA